MRRTCLLLAALALPLAACGTAPEPTTGHGDAAGAQDARGPHNGRLLVDGDFALELTVFEDGVPPEYRLYAYRADRPVPPGEVRARVTIRRIDGETKTFAFHPQGDFLRADGVLAEPHSFDVAVVAQTGGRRHQWRFAAYEGRTTLTPEAIRTAGIETATAGAAEVGQTLELVGRVELDSAGSANVGAKFPGPVMAVYHDIGDRVARGALLARVESSNSLQTYSVFAPIGGIVTQRNTNVGDVAGNGPMFVISDPSRTVATFPVFPRDIERVTPGQPVQIRVLDGDRAQSSTIRDFLPLAQVQTQSVTARATLPNPGGLWRPGMAVRGIVTTERHAAALAVRSEAIQQFRDRPVVFARVGDSFEVRMLEIGRAGPEWTEVTGGLKPGTVYATKNSYLLKADIEKSGAAHDH